MSCCSSRSLFCLVLIFLLSLVAPSHCSVPVPPPYSDQIQTLVNASRSPLIPPSAAGAAAAEDPVTAVRSLLQRRLPGYVDYFQFTLLDPAPGNREWHQYQSVQLANESVIIQVGGSSGVQMALAVNRYLRKYAKVTITSWSTNENDTPMIALPLPSVPSLETHYSPRPFNFYFNPVTFGYSTLWWDWSRWQRELDWAAFSGINMLLALNGQEKIWQELYKDLGLTETEIQSFFTGPAFLAWQRFGNIQAFGGPLEQSWIDGQAQLQMQILAQMRSMGQIPVLPGFNGYIPAGVKRIFPNDAYNESAAWSLFQDFYCCPVLLQANSSIFQLLGTKFIQYQISQWGSNHFYLSDTFNENPPPSGALDYLQAMGAAVYRSMKTADAEAVFTMQAWLFYQEREFWSLDRTEALLSGVPNDRMLLLDLFAEEYPVHSRTNQLFGKPFIWCELHDFGGDNGYFGLLPTLAKAPYVAAANASNMAGTGICMEGIDQNEIVYDIMLEAGWRNESIANLTDWVQDYAITRYNGLIDPGSPATLAWDILLRTVYNATTDDPQKGVTQSRIATIPALSYAHPYTNHARETRIWYHNGQILQAVQHLLSAAAQTPSLLNLSRFQYDLVDCTRQWLSNIAIDYTNELTDQFQRSNATAVQQIGTRYLGLISDVETLLASNERFLLGRWIRDSQQWAIPGSRDSSELFEFNARNLLTIWGTTGEGTRNYAVRLWSGLVGDLYLPRWQLWIDELLLALQSNRGFSQARFDIRVKQLELQWQMQFDTKYPVEPMGNSLSIVQGLVGKYGIHYPEHYQMQVEEVAFQLQDTPSSMLEDIIGFA